MGCELCSINGPKVAFMYYHMYICHVYVMCDLFLCGRDMLCIKAEIICVIKWLKIHCTIFTTSSIMLASHAPNKEQNAKQEASNEPFLQEYHSIIFILWYALGARKERCKNTRKIKPRPGSALAQLFWVFEDFGQIFWSFWWSWVILHIVLQSCLSCQEDSNGFLPTQKTQKLSNLAQFYVFTK